MFRIITRYVLLVLIIIVLIVWKSCLFNSYFVELFLDVFKLPLCIRLDCQFRSQWIIQHPPSFFFFCLRASYAQFSSDTLHSIPMNENTLKRRFSNSLNSTNELFRFDHLLRVSIFTVVHSKHWNEKKKNLYRCITNLVIWDRIVFELIVITHWSWNILLY